MYVNHGSQRRWIHFDVKNHLNLVAECGGNVAALRRRFEELRTTLPREKREGNEAWMRLEAEVLAADEAVTLPAEPWALEAIRPLRPAGVLDRLPVDPERVPDQIRGSWMARLMGCTLGKPVESFLAEEGPRRLRMKQYLQKAGTWPLDGYVPEEAVVPYWKCLAEQGIAPHWLKVEPNWNALREHITHCPEDDDPRYTLIALRKVQVCGRQFGLKETRGFLAALNPGSEEGRGTVACNLVCGLSYPQAARYAHTGREWLGGQIRSDLYGIIAPGGLAEAAAMAWHDAAACGSESGIYGAMWQAAAIAAAHAGLKGEEVVRAGLGQIPAECRLALALRDTIQAWQAHPEDHEATLAEIERRVGHYHCIHTIPNCCLVAAAVLHGGGDVVRTICLAVQGGLDTDCNGANAGAIVGAGAGLKGISESWYRDFHDCLHTGMPHQPRCRISGIADEMISLWAGRGGDA